MRLDKEQKQRIKEQRKRDQQARKSEKDKYATLSPEARTQAVKEAKLAQNQAKVIAKKEFQKLPKEQQKIVRAERKYYNRIQRRPWVLTVWTLIFLLLFWGVSTILPFVLDAMEVMSGKHFVVNSPSARLSEAQRQGDAIALRLAQEGIVLLQNHEKLLPLKEMRLNVFGYTASQFRYGGGGSGSADHSRAINFYEGLEKSGILYNPNLYDLYFDDDASKKKQSGIMEVVESLVFGTDNHDEPAIDYLTDTILSESKGFSSQALVVIASSATEASDMSPEQLRLTTNQRALMDRVTSHFDSVILVVNAGNMMELGFIEDYPTIKSVVWVGTPGPHGTQALGEILSGKVNPSGRLADTIAYDNTSTPASVNFGNYQYTNMKRSFINYQESIYVGYRYYESAFADNEVAYQEQVQFPFGYGLSYTDFDWEVLTTTFEDEWIGMEVRVTNVGEMAGKDVLQLYYTAPYYAGGIEKSAMALATFAKSKLLEPQESQIINLHFPTRLMASYDESNRQAYILEAGDYFLHLAHNVHDIEVSYKYPIMNEVVYTHDDKTGQLYRNQFTSARGDITYLSRDDFTKTYPDDHNISFMAPDFVIDGFKEFYPDSGLSMPSFGVDNGILLADLKGLEFDDPKWQAFLDQFTLEELMSFVTQGAYRTIPIERLGVPQTILLDGPAGFNFMFSDKIQAVSYPTQVVIATTWNEDLAYQMGQSVANEAKAYGILGWYAPAYNLHRTPMGGRNFEYFSEDPILTGMIGGSMAQGAQDQGVIVFIKHFIMNDQETNARSGINVWANEQAIRELYLKPFELAVKRSGAMAAMSSFSFIGEHWAGANRNLLENVLRDEWGFDGFVSSDAVFGFMRAPDATLHGNGLMLDIFSKSLNLKRLKRAYKSDPSGISQGLRTSVHRVLYTILRSYLYE